MTEHDPLCPLNIGPPIADVGPLAYCQCDLIEKVRTNERIRLTRDEGWFTAEAHEAVRETTKERSRRGTLGQLRDHVFALQEDAWIEYRSAVPGDVERVALMCHQIEAYKYVIETIDEELS